MKKPLIAIVGPTAVGKTAVGIKLAQKCGGAVISGDSMQVYRRMNIGTAKPDLAEREGIPHFLIDIADPDEDYSVARFQEEAETVIGDLHRSKKMPILVGGTGLYVRSLIDHYDFPELPADRSVREELTRETEVKGEEWLRRELEKYDPVAARKIHPNDRKRAIRALEVYRLTGRPISLSYGSLEAHEPRYEAAMFALTMDRAKLYERINHRVDNMIAKGLLEEVSSLREEGFGSQNTSMQGIGYKELIGYLEGEYSFEEAVELIKKRTRHFARRQLIWFRRDKRVQWLDVEEYITLTEIANEIYRRTEGLFRLL